MQNGSIMIHFGQLSIDAAKIESFVQTSRKLELNQLTVNLSTSTFKKMTLLIFSASSTKTGAMARQGPHHAAVKSTTICRIKIV